MKQHADEAKTTEVFNETRTRQAFKAFSRAFEEGRTDEFLAMVTDDFHFCVPLPLEEWKNEQRGKHRFDELVRFEREVLRIHMTSLLELEDTNNGMVVFSAEGMLNQLPYSNKLAVVFEFENNRIRSFHEYVGMPLKSYEG